ncbi:MAG: tyrosine-type recombinase/integrase [Rhodospirillaceae bacterium]|nr:tyrosine-type recombinase/integrase [Rhodospirillaceae bacterium]
MAATKTHSNHPLTELRCFNNSISKRTYRRRKRQGKVAGLWMRWRRKLRGKRPPTFERKKITLQEALARYAEMVLKPGAPAIRYRVARNQLIRFAEFCGEDTPIANVREPNLAAYRDLLVARGSTSVTINHHFSAIHSFLRCCAEEWRIIKKAPRLKLWRERQRSLRFLSFEEEARLISQCETPVRKLAVFILGTGFRLSEALNMRWKDIDLDHGSRGVARLGTSKNGSPHAVPLPKHLALMLRQMKDDAPAEPEFVFLETPTRDRRDFHGRVAAVAGKPKRLEYPHKSFMRARKASGLHDVTFHTLRHTYATRLVLSGVPIFEVSHLLNHRAITSTMHYAHLAPGRLDHAIGRLDEYISQASHAQAPVADQPNAIAAL